MPKEEGVRKNREGAGKSQNSWIKHNFFAKVVAAQVAAAFRSRAAPSRAILIDGNAGDGGGVILNQADLFDGAVCSQSSAALLMRLGREYGATVCLCDKDIRKRETLFRLFPSATIVESHAQIPRLAQNYNYALWLSDPCGPAGHGMEYMRAVANSILRSDFVIAFNEGSVTRMLGTKSGWDTHCTKYGPMMDPQWWISQLGKRYLARTPIIKQSEAFRFRLLVASHYLADAILRIQNVEIIRKEGK
jgi:hypothetical protein